MLKPTGRMAFLNIHPSSGLDEKAYRRSLRVGPPAVGLRRRTQRELLETAGFEVVEWRDVTESYRGVRTALLDLERGLSSGDTAGSDDEAARARLRCHLESLEAIDTGLHRRTLIVVEPR